MRLHSLPRFATTAATALVLLGGVLAQSPAAHAEDWCWDDPVVNVAGHQLNIVVGVAGSHEQVKANVKGAWINVTLPYGVSRQFLGTKALGAGKETLGIQTGGDFVEGVTFSTAADTYTAGQPIPVKIDIWLPMSKKAGAGIEVSQTDNGVAKTLLSHPLTTSVTVMGGVTYVHMTASASVS